MRRLGRRNAAADSRISAVFGTVARKENDASTVCRAAAPSAEVRLVLPRKRSRFATHSSSVIAKKPFTPSFATSQFTPTGEATTGLLAAMYCTSL